MTRRRELITANIGNGSHSTTARGQRRHLKAIVKANNPAIVATQEAEAALTLPGYRKFSGPRGLRQLAVFVRNDVEVDGHGSHLSLPGQPRRWPDRGLVWVRLEDGLTVINVHLNAGIEDHKDGTPRPGHPWHGHPNWVAAQEHLEDIDNHVEHLRNYGRVVLVGDFNVDQDADRHVYAPQFPARRFHRLGLVEALYSGHSLPRRAVDRVFVEARDLRVRDADLLARRKGFDHRPLRVRVEFKR